MATKPVHKKAKRLKLETTETLYDLAHDEVSALSKPRTDFDQHVEDLLGVYEDEIADLKIPGMDPAKVRARLASYAALARLEADSAKYAEMVRETRLLHAAGVWDALLAIYDKAKAVARHNQDVARGIADFTQFMKQAPRKKAPKTG